MEGLFAAQTARRWKLPPNIRRLIVDLKAEYPPFNLNEIANVVRACFGRKPDARSVERVLDAEVRPLKLQRNYPRYHEMGPGEGRAAVVELRVDGWSAKAIAGSQMGPLVGAYRAGLAAYRIGLAVLDRFAWTRYGAPFAEPANDGNRDEPGWRLLRHTGVWFQTPAEENRTEEPVIGGQDPGSSRRWPLSPRTGRRAPRGAPARRGGAAMT